MMLSLADASYFAASYYFYRIIDAKVKP